MKTAVTALITLAASVLLLSFGGCSDHGAVGTCGNGWADTAVGEECDDGNNVGGDGCGPTCRFEHCGNGVVDVMEDCDDGNIQDGDGCSAACKNEDQCGNGFANVAGGESCDGTDLAGESCSGLGYSSGQLGCTTTCDYNTSGCYTCGNGICEPAEDPGSCASDCSETSDVDLLMALNNNPNNTGFLRSGSVPAVLFLTSEDDCSASTSNLFDTSQNDINAPLGFLHSFRCFEFGVTCDINDRTATGPRHNCAPREGPGTMLHFISEYETFLNLIRDPGKLVVAAIAGPNDDSTVEVQPDTNGRPTVQPSCGIATVDGIPGIRMRSFVEAFNPVPDRAWTYSSICAADYTAALSGIGQAIRDRLH